MEGSIVRAGPATLPGDRENADGFTKLGAACYALYAAEAIDRLDSGVDPDKRCSFAGGCTPLLLTIAGYVDKVENCLTAYRVFYAAECVQILEALRVAEAKFELPASVLLDDRTVYELAAACMSAGFEDLRQRVIEL